MGGVSARERRESVIRAAIAEFAVTVYRGTTTAAIAERKLGHRDSAMPIAAPSLSPSFSRRT